MGVTAAPVVVTRVVTNEPAAAKFHKEVDLASSKSYTDEERPTKMPRVEATTMNDSTYSTSPTAGFNGYIMQCFKDSVPPDVDGLCMPCNPRCVSPDFDETVVPELIPRKKDRLDEKVVRGLIPRKKDRQGAMILRLSTDHRSIRFSSRCLEAGKARYAFMSAMIALHPKANGYCMKHGGQRKNSQVCKKPDCESGRSANGYCMKHGGRPYASQVCKKLDCESGRSANGYCMKHGGQSKLPVCKKPDCESASSANGFCMKHGGRRYASCKKPDCERKRTANGYCMKHGGQRKSQVCENNSSL